MTTYTAWANFAAYDGTAKVKGSCQGQPRPDDDLPDRDRTLGAGTDQDERGTRE